MVAALDISGERYGRLVAVERAESPSRRTKWLFECDCGAKVVRGLEQVRAGMTRSCGCLRKETTAARSVTHGHSRDYRHSPELRAWQHAKGRCFCPTDAKYPIYGGRGITMCAEWANDFSAFYRDMGPRPEGTTLDRIDVNGNYAPGNCRWATSSQQARTRTDNVIVEHEGKRMVLKDFAAAIGVNYKSLHGLMRRAGMSAREAAAKL